MDLSLTPEDLAFRNQVRAFLDANLTEDLRRTQRLCTLVQVDWDAGRPWQALLHAAGWGAPSWPKKYGGTGWTLKQRFLFDQECSAMDAPKIGTMGLELCGPVLMRYGTPEQKACYLPRMISGEDYWCQGYSEPGAGSDLANLRTKAVRDGEQYVINGAKIWTTHAHWANWMFALVRTGSTGRRQEGITFLLIHLPSPGLTIKPLYLLGGEHDLNEVFFDNVRVPVSNRVGEENQGWQVSKYLLECERGGIFMSGRTRAQFRYLLEFARTTRHDGQPAIEHPAIALKLAESGGEFEGLENMELRLMSADGGAMSAAAPSMLKVRGYEIRQDISELAVTILGEQALRARDTVPASTRGDMSRAYLDTVAPTYLNDRAGSIYGGTTEIQLTLIARGALGL
jgi:alkylation response protein AidB-like acyl-CoA dehydrogenase